jgi:S1-C subfamily serine protease
MGYPAHLLLGSELKFTEGSVSLMSGLTGEDAFMQISIPIQPGNSGGPVVTFSGLVIGIVSSTTAIKPFLNFTGLYHKTSIGQSNLTTLWFYLNSNRSIAYWIQKKNPLILSKIQFVLLRQL